jgi:hypothetical protein
MQLRVIGLPHIDNANAASRNVNPKQPLYLHPATNRSNHSIPTLMMDPLAVACKDVRLLYTLNSC